MEPAFTFILALFVSMALIPPLAHIAGRLGLLDSPGGRKVHAAPVPRIGGIAIVAGTVIPLLLWAPIGRELEGFLLAALVLFAFGIWDDRADLDYRVKLFGQFIAVLIVTLYGGVVIERFPFMEGEGLPAYISIPLTMFVLIGVTNAINLSDGLDGLAGGTSLLAIGCMGVFAYLAGDTAVVFVVVALAGALLGFLRFNTYPARVFMGDTGSQFLGFSAGVLALILTQSSNQALSPMLPLLLLGLPIMDTLFVMTLRIWQGRSPFKPDRNHIHHKLMALGLNHYEVVLVYYVLQATLISAAFLLGHKTDTFILITYLIFSVVMISGFQIASRGGWRLRSERRHGRFMSISTMFIRRCEWLSWGSYGFIKAALPFLLVLGCLVAGHVPLDLGAFSTVLLTALVFSLFLRSIPFSLLERFGIYVAAVSSVYLLEISPGVLDGWDIYINSIFFALAVAVAIGVRFSGPEQFQVSTLDFLVVFIAVLMPLFPDVEFINTIIAAIVLKTIILLYATEVLLTRSPRYWDGLRVGTIVALALLGVKGLV